MRRMQSKARERSLASLRHGSRGELREGIRCMLIRIMGHEDCSAILQGKPIPHWFPRSPLTPHELRGLMVVAHDGLLELGYDAAAEELADRGRDPFFAGHTTEYYPYRSKRALEILEAGPPSVRLSSYLVFKRPMHRIRNSYVVARAVEDTALPWYRFVVGTAVHDNRGQFIGWAHERGYTFEGRYRTLTKARERA